MVGENPKEVKNRLEGKGLIVSSIIVSTVLMYIEHNFGARHQEIDDTRRVMTIIGDVK